MQNKAGFFIAICQIYLSVVNLILVSPLICYKFDFVKSPNMATDAKKLDKKAGKGPSPEEILNGFQTLRTEQRNFSSKLSEVELDLNEHKMVIETLKNVNEDRRCFRLIGGVLTERKVKDVLPVLISNEERLKGLIEKINENIAKKGQEINEYREKYNIRFRGLDNPKQEEQVTSPESRGNVLVS